MKVGDRISFTDKAPPRLRYEGGTVIKVNEGSSVVIKLDEGGTQRVPYYAYNEQHFYVTNVIARYKNGKLKENIKL